MKKEYDYLVVGAGLFGGRLAQYTYADMDDTMAAALQLWKKEYQRILEH
ncbi:MAG: hypothetical protein MSK40_04970 [Parabacteroides sp.]|nr:hypothetical protein [Parabacteroides sp.]